jgi:hypothetical protein
MKVRNLKANYEHLAAIALLLARGAPVTNDNIEKAVREIKAAAEAAAQAEVDEQDD